MMTLLTSLWKNAYATASKVRRRFQRQLGIPDLTEKVTLAYCPVCSADAWWTGDEYRVWLQADHNKSCPGTWHVIVGNDRPCHGRNSNVCVAEGCMGQECLND